MKILGFIFLAFTFNLFHFSDVALAQSSSENRVTGISCFAYVGDKLLALTGSSQNTSYIYEITQGGLGYLHTKDAEEYPGITCPVKNSEQFVITSGEKQYKAIPNKSIEISTDKGQTWHKVVELTGVNTHPRMFFQTRLVKNYFEQLARQKAEAEGAGALTTLRAEQLFAEKLDIREVPLDAIVDKQSGNAIFAMGTQGLLVVNDAGYQWGKVDVYQHLKVSNSQAIGLLEFELWVMIILGFLLMATLFQLITFFQPFKLAILGFAWLLWFYSAIALLQLRSPPFELGSAGGGIFFSMFAFLVSAFAILAIAGKALDDLPITFKHILALTVLGTPLYLLPLILWTQGVIPSYAQAFIISLVLIAIHLIASWYGLRRFAKLPTWFTNKKSQPVA